MKHFLIVLASAIAIACHGQADWTSLFQADPALADGFFIVDLEKSNNSGVSHVEVDIIASELQHDGSTDVRILETLNIDLSEGFYARLDFDKWSELMDPYRVLYHARGLSPGGDIVIDVEETGDGGSLWPEACRETCVSMLYAYTLVAYSNNSLATIHLHDGTVNGSYTYIYIKASNYHSNTGGFKSMFTPAFFGIGLSWNDL